MKNGARQPRDVSNSRAFFNFHRKQLPFFNKLLLEEVRPMTVTGRIPVTMPLKSLRMTQFSQRFGGNDRSILKNLRIIERNSPRRVAETGISTFVLPRK
jgi:hypothetical protein